MLLLVVFEVFLFVCFSFSQRCAAGWPASPRQPCTESHIAIICLKKKKKKVAFEMIVHCGLSLFARLFYTETQDVLSKTFFTLTTSDCAAAAITHSSHFQVYLEDAVTLLVLLCLVLNKGFARFSGKTLDKFKGQKKDEKYERFTQKRRTAKFMVVYESAGKWLHLYSIPTC